MFFEKIKKYSNFYLIFDIISGPLALIAFIVLERKLTKIYFIEDYYYFVSIMRAIKFITIENSRKVISDTLKVMPKIF
jgi:hypothetical protein